MFLLLLTLLGTSAAAQLDSTILAWPPAPERARIQHIRTISSMQSLDQPKGLFSRVLGFLFGGKQTPRWLVQPVGIAVAPSGRLYVADPGANGVHVIEPERQEYHFISETKYGKFISPVACAVAPDGTVFVSDSERSDIIVLDTKHRALFQIEGKFMRPTGLKIANGKLYVIDTGLHRIAVFDLSGKYLSEFGRRGTGAGEFNYPVQLAIADSICVVDALNYRIQKFDLAGHFGSTFGDLGNVAGRFASPKAVELDSDRNVYVTDALMDNIQIFDSSGRLLLIVGRNGTRDGEFMTPNGIAIDRNDRIYVVETLNRRIQIFQYVK